MTTTNRLTTLQVGDPVKGTNGESEGILLAIKVWKNGKIRFQVLHDGRKKPHWYGAEFWSYSWAWLERVAK
jgi:hypothetical protein